MGGVQVERFSGDIASATLIEALERDGCAIVEGALDDAQLRGLNADLDGLIEATRPGVRHGASAGRPAEAADAGPLDSKMDALLSSQRDAEDEWVRDFYGHHTVRIDGLAGKSSTFVDVMCHPLLTAAADHFLLPNCKSYLRECLATCRGELQRLGASSWTGCRSVWEIERWCARSAGGA